MAKDFMKPPGGPQVTTQDRPQPSKPRKTRRLATPPRAVTEQPIPKDFRSPPSAPLDIDNKVYRPPPQVAPQAPYNRPVPTAPMVDPWIPEQPENRRMRPPGPPMDLPPRAHPMTTTPFAQRPFNPFAPVTPPAPSFPMNPIFPRTPVQDPRFANRRGSLRNLLNRGLSEGVGQQ